MVGASGTLGAAAFGCGRASSTTSTGTVTGASSFPLLDGGAGVGSGAGAAPGALNGAGLESTEYAPLASTAAQTVTCRIGRRQWWTRSEIGCRRAHALRDAGAC